MMRLQLFIINKWVINHRPQIWVCLWHTKSQRSDLLFCFVVFFILWCTYLADSSWQCVIVYVFCSWYVIKCIPFRQIINRLTVTVASCFIFITIRNALIWYFWYRGEYWSEGFTGIGSGLIHRQHVWCWLAWHNTDLLHEHGIQMVLMSNTSAPSHSYHMTFFWK